MPIVPPEFLPMITLFVLIGAVSAMLANRGLVIFHDGLRPMMPMLYESKDMTRAQVSAISFALMIGFFVGFGVPFSIGKVIPLVYLIFLVTDWIGISLPGKFEDNWKKDRTSLIGFYGAGLAGAAWGAIMAIGVGNIPAITKLMPVDMLNPMTEITGPLTSAFALFPVLTVAYRYGWKKGIVSLVLAVLVHQVSTLWLHAPSGIPWALLTGTILLIIFAVIDERKQAKENEGTNSEEESDDSSFLSNRVNRIKKNIIPIALLAFLCGIAINYPVMALDPPQGPLYAKGLKWEAFLVLLSLGVAFFPMKFTTALVSGSMMTFSFFDGAIAVIMPNWWLAGIAVAVWKFVEIYALVKVGSFLNRYPSVRSLSDDIRTAIYNVMEIGLLIGSAIAANKIAPGWGFMVVPAAWWINNYAGAPIVRMGIGPIAVIAVGILANIFKVIGLL
jgi:hypothetical protein